MKIIKKNVYYCEHCKKKGLSASAMTKHERGCTANPKRECRMCDGNDIPEIVSMLKTRFELEVKKLREHDWGHEYEETVVNWKGDVIKVDEVRNLVDGCPTCMLAVIRQTGLNRYWHKEFGEFDFKKEMQWAVSEKNKSHHEWH